MAPRVSDEIKRLSFESLSQSGREDLNLRPLAPHASALAGLRHAPIDWQGGIIASFQESGNLTHSLCKNFICLLPHNDSSP